MTIQTIYSIVFTVLIVSLAFCAYNAHKSDKPVGKYTCLFSIAVITPILGNLITINADTQGIAILGYYLYYIGMTLTMMSLVSFTNIYCRDIDNISNKHKKQPTIMYILGGIDIIQIALGPITKHVFTVEPTLVSNKIYYADTANIGLTLHRIIDYILFFCILIIFILSAIKTSKLYREKFTIIIINLIIAGIIQIIFIVSKIPVDRSVIVHGIFGIMLYYFSIKYRPLRLLDMVLSNIAADMDDAVYVFDSLNKCVWANEPGYALLNIKEGKTGLVKAAILKLFSNDIVNKGENWVRDIYIKERDSYYTLEKKSIKSNNLIDGCFLIVRDNTNRRKKVEQEIYEANHDSLTDLYNMSYLYSHIKNELAVSQKDYYIIYINIRNFKIINDVFGRDFGDKVIIQVAKWLKTNIGKKGTYGRLIGDTFGIFIPVENFDENLFLTSFSDFVVKYKKITHKICVHIGIYKIKDKNIDVSVMFDRAHLALSSITDNYKTIIKYYDEDLRNLILEEQRLAADLDTAINTNQIKPYLQPIMDVTGHIVGAEVLARWIHPELGLLPPIKFIPAFEKNGLIIDLDRYIWKCACQILQQWKGIHDDLFISINISPKDFYFVDVVSEIKRLVEEYDIEPIKLRIEITESVMMTDSEEKFKIFDTLREEGFIVEMDDFGSGYSSLNLLKDMPVDVLKLDMKFLSDTSSTHSSDKSNTILKNIINLSNELKMTTLTEGVETQQQYNQLIQMGCALFQGYYFAKPMPLDEFEQFINEQPVENGV